jgi:hypothetical protein
MKVRARVRVRVRVRVIVKVESRESGLSKRSGVTFLTYYFPIISRTLGARKFIQAPFDAARHALFML